jgi:hypothetical protein
MEKPANDMALYYFIYKANNLINNDVALKTNWRKLS